MSAADAVRFRRGYRDSLSVARARHGTRPASWEAYSIGALAFPGEGLPFVTIPVV